MCDIILYRVLLLFFSLSPDSGKFHNEFEPAASGNWREPCHLWRFLHCVVSRRGSEVLWPTSQERSHVSVCFDRIHTNIPPNAWCGFRKKIRQIYTNISINK